MHEMSQYSFSQSTAAGIYIEAKTIDVGSPTHAPQQSVVRSRGVVVVVRNAGVRRQMARTPPSPRNL